MLGHQADEREYWAAAGILEDLGVTHVRLLTNNPAKIEHLRALGVAAQRELPGADWAVPGRADAVDDVLPELLGVHLHHPEQGHWGNLTQSTE